MTMRGRLIALLAASLLPLQGLAQVYGDELYRPFVGQAGKDVVWVPTPEALISRMLATARTTDKDFVVDLGAGDGRIAIAAAKEFGARALGIEYNPDMAALAKRNVQRAGVADKASIVEGDIFKEDFSKATVVAMYLLPELNLKLRPLIMGMKPGTRVVSHQFHMGEWEPDELIEAEGRTAYYWLVPAPVAGEWTIREDKGPLEMKVSIAQSFQRIGGTVSVGGSTQPMLGGALRGNELWFGMVDPEGRTRGFRGVVSGDRVEGQLRFPSGGASAFTGTRR